MLRGDESLFIDTMPLDADYVPPIIKYRENEQQYIASCLKPLFQKRNGKNLLITGQPGIGKTVAVKHLLNELEKETSEIIPLYINCWKKDTAHKIALDICDQIGFKFVQNRDTSELFREITRILNKKAVVLVLDEADKISDQQIFYMLTEDVYTKSLLFITNDSNWINELDERVKSRLLPEVLEFKPYKGDEIRGILQERIKYAFVPGVFGEDAFTLVTEKTTALGDMRIGLHLLKQAGEIAEGESKRAIEKIHAEKAIKTLGDFRIKQVSTLSHEEDAILLLIKNNSGCTTKQLYDMYKEKGTLSYSSFQRKIKHLESGKFIMLKEINKGQPGRSTIVEYGTVKKLNEF